MYTVKYHRNPTTEDFLALYQEAKGGIRGFLMPNESLHLWDGNTAWHDDVLRERPEFSRGMRLRFDPGRLKENRNPKPILEIDWDVSKQHNFPINRSRRLITEWILALPALSGIPQEYRKQIDFSILRPQNAFGT